MDTEPSEMHRLVDSQPSNKSRGSTSPSKHSNYGQHPQPPPFGPSNQYAKGQPVVELIKSGTNNSRNQFECLNLNITGREQQLRNAQGPRKDNQRNWRGKPD